MGKYFTEKQFIWLGIAVMVILFSSIFVLWNIEFPFDGKGDYGSVFGSLHIGLNILIVIALIATLVYYFWMLDSDYKKKHPFLSEETPTENKRLISKKTKMYFYSIFILFLAYIFIYKPMSKLYNEYQTNIFATNAINAEKKLFYDKLWKTFLQKDKICAVNKDAFMTIAKIAMDGRADGAKITWKWVNENTPIPFEEYTKFYADLSNFITEQREEYFKLENKANKIANDNNLMLSTFPNNLYNVVLRCKQIEYQAGFSSDRTDKTFGSKKENEIF